ncbi:hypothetical protein HDU76_014134 [Blyttiomyces sp. JEL0837]|nr:hypothetical protein HDU76_014134 [Blyttiomyces sp. JEL0837]
MVRKDERDENRGGHQQHEGGKQLKQKRQQKPENDHGEQQQEKEGLEESMPLSPTLSTSSSSTWTSVAESPNITTLEERTLPTISSSQSSSSSTTQPPSSSSNLSPQSSQSSQAYPLKTKAPVSTSVNGQSQSSATSSPTTSMTPSPPFTEQTKPTETNPTSQNNSPSLFRPTAKTNSTNTKTETPTPLQTPSPTPARKQRSSSTASMWTAAMESMTNTTRPVGPLSSSPPSSIVDPFRPTHQQTISFPGAFKSVSSLGSTNSTSKAVTASPPLLSNTTPPAANAIAGPYSTPNSPLLSFMESMAGGMGLSIPYGKSKATTGTNTSNVGVGIMGVNMKNPALSSNTGGGSPNSTTKTKLKRSRTVSGSLSIADNGSTANGKDGYNSSLTDRQSSSSSVPSDQEFGIRKRGIEKEKEKEKDVLPLRETIVTVGSNGTHGHGCINKNNTTVREKDSNSSSSSPSAFRRAAAILQQSQSHLQRKNSQSQQQQQQQQQNHHQQQSTTSTSSASSSSSSSVPFMSFFASSSPSGSTGTSSHESPNAPAMLVEQGSLPSVLSTHVIPGLDSTTHDSETSILRENSNDTSAGGVCGGGSSSGTSTSTTTIVSGAGGLAGLAPAAELDEKGIGHGHGQTTLVVTPLPNAGDKRTRELRKVFPEMGANEILLEDFACAYQKPVIMIQGKLYVTSAGVCFYSNILGYKEKLSFLYSEIRNVSKKKFGGMIPNAIQIVTDEKYLFHNFLFRDSAYDLITKVWRAQSKAPRTLTHPLRSRSSASTGAGAAHWNEDGNSEDDTVSASPVHHQHNGDDLSSDSSEGGHGDANVGALHPDMFRAIPVTGDDHHHIHDHAHDEDVDDDNASVSVGTSGAAGGVSGGNASASANEMELSHGIGWPVPPACDDAPDCPCAEHHDRWTPLIDERYQAPLYFVWSLLFAGEDEHIKGATGGGVFGHDGGHGGVGGGQHDDRGGKAGAGCHSVAGDEAGKKRSVALANTEEMLGKLASFTEFRKGFLEADRKCSDISIGGWKPPGDGEEDGSRRHAGRHKAVDPELEGICLENGATREIEYRIPLGIVTPRTFITEHLVAATPSYVCVKSSSSTPEVHLGDHFRTNMRLCLTSPTSTTTRLRISYEVEFIKPLNWMLQKGITTTMKPKVVEFHDSLKAAIHVECNKWHRLLKGEAGKLHARDGLPLKGMYPRDIIIWMSKSQRKAPVSRRRKQQHFQRAKAGVVGAGGEGGKVSHAHREAEGFKAVGHVGEEKEREEKKVGAVSGGEVRPPALMTGGMQIKDEVITKILGTLWLIAGLLALLVVVTSLLAYEIHALRVSSNITTV